MKQALEQHTELGCRAGGGLDPVDGAPGTKPLVAGGEAAYLGLGPVGEHQDLVGVEQARDLRLVGLELVPRRLERGVLVLGVLQLDDGDGQAVEEDHQVGPAVVLPLDDGHLVHHEPVVAGRIVEVHEACEVTPDATVPAHLYFNALDQPPVELVVVLLERRALRTAHPADHLVDGVGREVGVEAGYSGAQPPLQDHRGPRRPLRCGAVGGEVAARHMVVAQVLQPPDGGGLDLGLGEGGSAHRPASWSASSASGTRISPEISLGRRVSRRAARVLFEFVLLSIRCRIIVA